MSESAPLSPEQPKVILNPERELEASAGSRPEHLLEAENLGKQAEAAREIVEQTAESTASEKQKIETLERSEAPVQSTHINRELKAITLRRELQTIRRKLPAPERLLSHVIHQPMVRAVSEAAGNTVSRPSGLLGGGLVALLGTTGYLYAAKHIGFRYNYFFFLALFAGGFFLGLVLELLVWAATRSRRHAVE